MDEPNLPAGVTPPNHKTEAAKRPACAITGRQLPKKDLIRLDEHLGRLTSRDLRQLSTVVPLETLKTVVDLAIEIGREGRDA